MGLRGESKVGDKFEGIKYEPEAPENDVSG
jgi:hypothetical protein